MPSPSESVARTADVGESPTIPHSVPRRARETELETQSNPVKRWLKSLGPGLVSGAADDDPSGIGTYSVAGAAFGFATLWTAIVTLPLMTVVQFICNKIAMVSGRGLAGVLRYHYPRAVLYPAVLALLIANTINVGADIAAIGAALGLFIPLPVSVLAVPVALAIVALQVWGHYRLIVTIFKWLALTLLAYIGAAILAHPDWGGALRATFIPQFRIDHDYITTVVAILGTTISPYLFFWQASQQVEEEVSQGRTTVAQRVGATDAELRRAKLDTVSGMFFCNLVFYFVILACAATLHASGATQIDSAAQAAEALKPLAGEWASLLFALGMIGAGFLAVPVLTGSSAYAIAETFGWKYGLDTKPWEAKQFYAVIALSTLLGMGIDFTGINPIKALYWTAVINGLLSPPLLVLIMLASNNKKIMGQRANGWFTNVFGWLATLVMLAAAIGMLATL